MVFNLYTYVWRKLLKLYFQGLQIPIYLLIPQSHLKFLG